MSNQLTVFCFLGCLISSMVSVPGALKSQEVVQSLKANPLCFKVQRQHTTLKKTRAILPFIDDFAYTGPYPDANLWVDSQAYINRVMSATPITQGIATLDGLNAFGRPYFSQSTQSGYADSLTSVPIDLSGYGPGDNVFLSFFYQPQGLGFAPENKDSLFLFFRTQSGQWVRVWQMRGSTLQGFKQELIPLDLSVYYHNQFQFRFVNLASLNTNDDVWNLDYIRLDANRNFFDTLTNDVAFGKNPGKLLKRYVSMPYRHFMVNPVAELSDTQWVQVNNGYNSVQSVSLQRDAIESFSGTPLNSQSRPVMNVPFTWFNQDYFNSYPVSYIPPSMHSPVTFRQTHYYAPVNTLDRRQNDTLIQDIVFDNYFAYDDGSAEKSYFLLGVTNFPAKTALQFELNEPDTLRGLMVHFGPQLPSAEGKYFSIVLYKSLGSGTTPDSVIHQQELYRVQYVPSINGFSTYAFDQPPVLDAGVYYIGITQPANFGSDSIYYGLDVNENTNAQRLSYNVDGIWYNSGINGSLMIRPMVGPSFIPTLIPAQNSSPEISVELYPNPAHEKVILKTALQIKDVRVFGLDGRMHWQGKPTEKTLDLSQITSGIYWLQLTDFKGRLYTKQLIKQ